MLTLNEITTRKNLSANARLLYIWFLLNADTTTNEIQVTHADMANAIGMSHYGLTLQLAALQGEGLIHVNRIDKPHRYRLL